MSELLVQDHAELDELFSELCVALELGELLEIHQRLDQFWARLAVHIRAEHLHLFPAILNAFAVEKTVEIGKMPSLAQAQHAIEELRRDHNFFMQELASAVARSRSLLNTNDQFAQQKLEDVRATVIDMGRGLTRHNALEENLVYRWTRSLLSEAQQAALAALINQELANLPPRFTESANAD